jgi:two-component system response regulator ResD
VFRSIPYLGKTAPVLVVDDELRTREVIRKYLEQAGFRVVEAENSDQAFQAIQNQPPSLILLDVMLPGMDGFAMTQMLRSKQTSENPLSGHTEVPIILLTARKDELDRVFGFEIGADDYVVKPFSPRELVGRVRAVLRRSEAHRQANPAILRFGEYVIDPGGRLLTHAGVPIALTSKEFDLLYYLASNPRQVLTHEQLLNAIWVDAPDQDHSVVTSRIYRLREKIEVDPDNPIFLQTVWGVGYKFQYD